MLLLMIIDDALCSYSEVLKLPRASARQHEGFKKWIDCYNPLYTQEQKFIEHPHDLLSMVSDKEDAAHRFLLSHPNLMSLIFRKKVKLAPMVLFLTEINPTIE
jgi:hypothetical protein